MGIRIDLETCKQTVCSEMSRPAARTNASLSIFICERSMFYGVFESFSWIDKVSFEREPPLILLTGEYIYELTKKKNRYRPEVILATCFY